MLSAWCGLACGLLEVGTRVLCRAIDPTRRLYFMSRHFVWLIPLVNLLVFLSVGLCLAGLTRIWPRMGAWLSPRFLCALVLLPMFMSRVGRFTRRPVFSWCWVSRCRWLPGAHTFRPRHDDG